MKNSMNIIRKELDKIFRNPRLIFSTFILPGLIIFLMYTFMGDSFSNQAEEVNSKTSIVYVINNPGTLVNDAVEIYKSIDEEGIKVEFRDYSEELDEITEEKKEEFNKEIEEETVNAYLFFEKDFEQKMINGAPKVECYANSSLNLSSAAANKLQVIIGIIQEVKTEELYGNVAVLTFNNVELASDDSISGKMLAMLLPMLIMIFVFAGGLSIGVDAIAGEKERGTIATLLMAPIKKEEIVVGKIISTVIITILSALGSFIGVALSLPNMGGLYLNASITNYGFVTYLELLVIIILIALMASCLFLTASTLAKTNKEATAYAMPIYILGMVVGVSTMFMDKVPSNIGPYFIPLYNLVLGIKAVFLGQLTLLQMTIITASTLVYFGAVTVLIAKLFKLENLMFAK